VANKLYFGVLVKRRHVASKETANDLTVWWRAAHFATASCIEGICQWKRTKRFLPSEGQDL